MKFRIFIMLMLLSLLLFGCMNQTGRNGATGTNSPPIDQTNFTGELESNEDIAIHLANVAQSVPDVNKAYAVVAGPYAVVGIDVDENLERQRVGVVKFSVTEALQEDPLGKTAIVVADGDVTERIRMMSARMREGEPIRGILDELSEIVARYMPTFPVDEQHIDIDENNKRMIEEFNTDNNPNRDSNKIEDEGR